MRYSVDIIVLSPSPNAQAIPNQSAINIYHTTHESTDALDSESLLREVLQIRLYLASVPH